MVVFQYSSESWSFSSLFTLIANSHAYKVHKNRNFSYAAKSSHPSKGFCIPFSSNSQQEKQGMTLQSLNFFLSKQTFLLNQNFRNIFFLIQFKT